MDHIEMTAVQALLDQERTLTRDDIVAARRSFPELTSGVTARIYVTVEVGDGSKYEIPVTVRLEFTHPVALI